MRVGSAVVPQHLSERKLVLDLITLDLVVVALLASGEASSLVLLYLVSVILHLVEKFTDNLEF